MTLPRAVVRAGVRVLIRPVMCQDRLPQSFRRRWIDLLASTPLPRGTTVQRVMVGGRPCEVVTAPTATSDAAVLHLHGGGFTTGSPKVHRSFAAHLSAATGTAIHVLDYRLAPEHPFPAALNDAVNAFTELASRGRPVAVTGDSAGGNLAVAVALRQRDAGGPPPAALALQSPALDLTMAAALSSTRRDPMLTLAWMRANGRDYAGSHDLAEPLLSPLHAELHGLPSTLVHVSTDELLYDDALQFVERMRDAGGDVQLTVLQDLWHVVHLHAGMLRAADEAVAATGSWLRERLEVTP